MNTIPATYLRVDHLEDNIYQLVDARIDDHSVYTVWMQGTKEEVELEFDIAITAMVQEY